MILDFKFCPLKSEIEERRYGNVEGPWFECEWFLSVVLIIDKDGK